MKIIGDYHIHSNFSHGKMTIDQIAERSKELGLKEIAITDHGYSYLFIGLNDKKVKKLKNEIELAKHKYGINIYSGVEANLLSKKGKTDLTSFQISNFDVIILGIHKTIWVNLKNFFTFLIPNILYPKSKKMIKNNTDSIVLALDKYKINILAHLNGHRTKVDVIRIAKKCVEKNVYIELNARRNLFTKDEMEQMIKLNVKFIVNTDAHKLRQVGNFDYIYGYIEKYKIPYNQIANLDKLPNFNKK